MKRPLKLTLWLCALAIIALIGAEIALRLSGIVDFPVYDTDQEIGYVLRPNQSGKFLRKNTWVVNEQSMSTTKWAPNGSRDLLLIGDSVVLGGNPLSQADRWGPLLEKRLGGWRVWPVAAGSWSAENETVYLDRHPDVAAEADVIVWVLNTGDLDVGSQWDSDAVHPRQRPLSALGYVLSKYVIPRVWKAAAPRENPFARDLISPSTESKLREHDASLEKAVPKKRIVFLIYPAQNELLPTNAKSEAFYQKFRQHLRADVGPGAEVFEVRDDPRWKASLYRDGIHPNAEGNAVLANILADWLAKPHPTPQPPAAML